MDATVPVELSLPPPGASPAKLDELLALSDAEIDVGRAALLISKEERPSLNVEACVARIDDCAARIARVLPPRALPEEIISAMNETLLRERCAPGGLETSFERFDLATLLEGGRGNCLAASVLYLAVAWRLGLPLEGVEAPGHYFVRFVRPRRSINVELTQWGESFADSHYRRWLRISPAAEAAGVHLKGDGPRETIAVILANRSAVRSAQGRFKEAAADARRALELRPRLPQAMVNLGRALEGAGELPEARSWYSKAADLDPNSADALNNLALLLVADRSSDDYQPFRAVELIERAVRIRPDRVAYRLSAARIYEETGQLDRAIHHAAAAVRIDPRSEECRRRLAECRRKLLSVEGAPAPATGGAVR
jgi:regulator of sirC expression with transglutaminase-like and TPR domain